MTELIDIKCRRQTYSDLKALETVRLASRRQPSITPAPAEYRTLLNSAG